MLSGERGVDDSAKWKERKSLMRIGGGCESGEVGTSGLGTEEYCD